MRRVALHLAVIIPLALVIFFFRLGAADWRGDTDAIQAQNIQNMVAGRGWVMPLRNGIHLLRKPPLFAWLGSASAWGRKSGGDTLDSRLPSALLATGCVLAVYGFAYTLAGGSTALWAALLLITTPQFIISARDSRVDMVFSVFLTFGLLLAWRVYDGQAGRRTAWLAALCVALATLTKGPLALALAGLVFGVTAVLVPPQPGWRALVEVPTLAASIVPPALWYLAATIEQGRAFLRLQLFEENFSRLTGGMDRSPVWYYIEPLFTLGLPWTLALPALARGESSLPARPRRFLWTWVIAMFALFTISFGKRRVYILPIRPALAILLAGWLVPLLERLRTLERPTTVPRALHTTMAAVVIVALGAMMAFRMGLGGVGASIQQWSYWWRLHLHDDLLSAVILIVGLGIGVDLIISWIWQRRFERAAYALVGTLALSWTIAFSSDAIVRGEALSFRHIAQRVSAEVGPSESLSFLAIDDESANCFLYHLRRQVPIVQPVSSQEPCTPPGPGAYLIAESRWDGQGCASDPRWHFIARGGPEIASHRNQRLVLARYGEQPH